MAVFQRIYTRFDLIKHLESCNKYLLVTDDDFETIEAKIHDCLPPVVSFTYETSGHGTIHDATDGKFCLSDTDRTHFMGEIFFLA